MKVLLVEDDKTLANGIKYSLENEGYQVEFSSNVVGATMIYAGSKVKRENIIDVLKQENI